MTGPREHPDQPDAYDTLGIEPRFDVDEAAVQRAWLRAAARCHPDRAADPAEAVRRTALLNDARAALLDPERRAETLLRRRGAPGTPDNTLPDGFLAEILEVREGLSEAQEAGNEAGLAAFQEWAAQRRRAYIDDVRRRFASMSEPGRPDEFAGVRRTLNAWRYIERMLEQIRPT